MTSNKTTLTKMTRQICTALAALLMVGAMASCSENQDTETAENHDAYISLSFSSNSANSTRAGESRTEGELANNESKADPNSESDIHSIKVWVFQSGKNEDANPIAYKEEALKDINGSYNLQLRFLRKIAGKEVENIDLYILANSESANIESKLSSKDFSNITRKELQNISFDSTFGIQGNGKPQNTEVPTTGLPISRAITNISVENHVGTTEAEAKTKGIKIPLVRAVSKLHFYFARKTGIENVKVTGIEVEGKTIPNASYIFPDETVYKENDDNQVVTSNKYDVNSTSYVSTVLKLNGVETDNIKEVEDPEKFKKDETQTAQDYLDAFKTAGIASHNLCYLRETTKAIKGKIYYSLGIGEKSVDFSIPTDGKAIRNRELVVYGYFLKGGKLCLDYQVLPWNKVISEIGWNVLGCEMYAWKGNDKQNSIWPVKPQEGDAEAVNCMVSKPGFNDKYPDHKTAKAGSSEAAFYFKMTAPTGAVWKAHLSNTEDFKFNSGTKEAWKYQGKSYLAATTGIARELPYQIKIGASKDWWTFNTANASDFGGEVTEDGVRYAKAYEGNNPEGIWTDFYITVSLDGVHEYELVINPKGQGGKYKDGRKFCGTDTRIRIFNLKAEKGVMYDDMQDKRYKEVYSKYLNK